MPDKKTESARQEVVRLISEMSDKQIMITFEAYKIQAEDETKTPEECVMLDELEYLENHRQGKSDYRRYHVRGLC